MPPNVRKLLAHFWRLWMRPVLPLDQFIQSFGLYRRYLSDWVKYQRLPGAEQASFAESYPRLFDRTPSTAYMAHYLYQGVWAAERIMRLDKRFHVDVGSEVNFISFLSVMTPVVFVDIRPLRVRLSGLTSLAGDLMHMPFAMGSIVSLSCLHVVEHIGLGRYGDLLDPLGTRRACAELERVLAPGGNLFISVPVGIPRLQFNAHRIHNPQQILEYFEHLDLFEFSVVDDRGNYIENVSQGTVNQAAYACGLYWLVKR